MLPTAPSQTNLTFMTIITCVCVHGSAALLLTCTDSSDPKLQELEHQVRTGLQLPESTPLLWNRLRDELACLAAEGAAPPAAGAQAHLLTRIDYVATQHKVS